jgi:malate dehydrogenase
VIDSVRSVIEPTPEGDNVALAVVSQGQYGVPEGLQFGFPVMSDGSSWRVADGFELDDYAREKLRITADELLQERETVQDLLG